MSEIVYASDPGLTPEEYIDVVGHSALGATRPLADNARIAAMLAGANLIVTARLDGRCVGVARGISDSAWVCYLADLAVHRDFQGRGIGTGLLRQCRQAVGDGVGIALLSVPGAVSYYDKLGETLGLEHYPHAYWLNRTRGL